MAAPAIATSAPIIPTTRPTSPAVTIRWDLPRSIGSSVLGTPSPSYYTDHTSNRTDDLSTVGHQDRVTCWYQCDSEGPTNTAMRVAAIMNGPNGRAVLRSPLL